MASGNGQPVQIVIVADPASGAVNVQAPGDNRLWQWMMAEALRILCREANKRDAEASVPKAMIDVVRNLPPL